MTQQRVDGGRSGAFEVMGLVPATLGPPDLAASLSRAGAVGLLDLEFCGLHEDGIRLAFERLLKSTETRIGLRITADHVPLIPSLLSQVASRRVVLVLAGAADSIREMSVALRPHPQLELLAEVLEAADAPELEALCDGVVLRGQEAGGWIGPDSSFILLQKIQGKLRKPFLVQGGIGVRSAAACLAAGAAGVVLDDALLLLDESPLPASLKAELGRLNGSECRAFGEGRASAFRGYGRPSQTVLRQVEELLRQTEAEDLGAAQWRQRMSALAGWSPESLLPLGQAVGLARLHAERYGSASRLVQAVRRQSLRQNDRAAELGFLDEHGPLATSHGTRWPVAQGPMTRVSDSAAFAAAVAGAGGLPFLALALMRGPEVTQLLTQVAARLDAAPWGVGLLGFVPQALRDEQCEAIWKSKPAFALIAGGRPDQAEEFEKRGIATYLHAPAPALLRLFLEQGARRFVFEGRECGGHVGPLASFPLWEQMVETLLAHVPAGEEKNVHVLFAGGIHDALSGAMVAALTAPLAERGMKVGVLMGTAYLFTHEIVASGAVVPGFQQAALTCERTVNLESGPGHVTRCVDSAFTADFQSLRRRLIREGRSVEDVRDALEDLNLGRLRLASKGCERSSAGKLVEVDAARQQRDGMYMIGQVATLRDRALPIEALHEDVCRGAQERLLDAREAREARVQDARPSDVAIVGIGVTLPRANSAEDYWQVILDRISVIREAPKDRWDSELFYDPDPKARDKIYSKWGGFLDEVPFDPMRFGIPPRSMKSIDPFQLLALETAARTLADAGYADGQFDRENTSVILGAGGGAGDLGAQYALRAELPRFVENPSPEVWDRLPEWTEESFAGTLLNVAAGRIANRLDFGGLNFTIDAACGSSLAAISLAVAELESGRSAMVLAGGFDTTQSAYAFTAFAKTQALSPTGKPRTFDQAADGITISEGVAMVALKRLADAERDGDRIYAVIKATAGSSDGRALGLTAPRTEGQVRALRRAYRKAGFSPSTLGLVEAHGTGTPVGDRTEAQTIAQALSESGTPPRSVALGSVKTILGHTKAAAGAAGLIKVALALHHRVLPAHHGVDKPIDTLAEPTAPVYLLKEPQPWLAGADHPRRAAASAFGFGGTNFHAVLEEYRGGGGGCGSARWPAELLLFRAPDVAALLVQVQRLSPLVQEGSRLRLSELAAALAGKAAAAVGQPVALAIVATDLRSLATDLTAIEAHLQGGTRPLPPHIRLARSVPEDEPPVAFLFPGQGAQYLGMGREAALYFPQMRKAFELADRTLRDAIPQRLSRYVLPYSAFDTLIEADQLVALTDTHIAQPAIGTVALGYLEIARALGLEARACAGHSYGEYAALMAAGVMTPVDFLKLSAVRGAAMADASRSSPPGGMAAVQARRERVQALIGGFEGMRVANHNMPEQSVISGPREALDRAVQKLEAEGLRATVLPVSGAFHTTLVAPARAPLTAAIHATPFSPARIEVYSNTTGAPYPREPQAMQRQLDEHLLSSVEFVTEIEAMYAAGCRVFVELGPKGICSGMARQTLAGRDVVATSLDGSGGGLRGLLIGLAELFASGVRLDALALFRHRELRRLDPDRLEEAARPIDLPKHTWMISGGCARPIDDPVHRTGAKPALSRQDAESARTAIERRLEADIEARLGQQIASSPVAPGTTASGMPPVVPSSITSEALVAYQQTMQQFLALQERVVSQFLNGGGAPAAPTAASLVATPAPLAMPPVATTAPAAAVEVREAQVAPETASAAPRAFDPRALLVGIVSERTGYPQDMLDLDADLEADLGIDSIKRVEILGAVRKGLPAAMALAAQGRMEKLTRTRSLRAILDELATLQPAPAAAAEAPAAPVAAAAAAVVGFDLRAALLGVVAERTGYPAEMLGMDADLEADLGIDSIKRVEILGAFRKQLPEALAASLAGGMEKLTRARSLGAILGLLPSAIESAAVTEPPAATAPAIPAAAPAAAATDRAAVRELLLRVVAERTGYPAEMLDAEADLEADLGIDSIKRVEILGALKAQVDPTTAATMSARMEKLTRARSLSRILDELAEATTPAAPAVVATAEPAANDAAAGPLVEDAPLPRYVVKSTRIATPEPAAAGFSGPVLVLGPDDELAARVRRELERRKLPAVHVTETDGSALREAIEAMRKQHGAVRGLLHLHGIAPAAASTLEQWRSLYQRDLLSLLHALQASLADLPQMRLIAASRLGGTFGRDAVGDGGPLAGGANGLLNCLRAEFPGVRARAVDFDGGRDTEIATALIDELLADSNEPEAGYIGVERFGSCTIEEPLVPNPFPESVEPTADWVLLATGGARGITAEIIEELACAGMRLVLLGRTPEPAAEDLALAARGIEEEVRKYLLAASLARGDKPRPVEIDRAVARVMTDREIRTNLQRLRATGATVDYVPCDVRDETAFGTLLDRLYERFGRIDAVIHGAGVIEDKRLGDKTAESFERVLGTKLDPAFVLASKLQPASLKLLAFFTSVAGRFGNLGQGDYAAANEALNRLAWDLHRRWTHTRVISINWGPWDAGMATEGVKRALRERGMEPIPVKAGRRFFREELAHGPRHEVELVAGRGPWGRRANETTPSPWTLDDVGMETGGVLAGRMQLRADGVTDEAQTLVAAMKRLVAIGWRGWTVADVRELRMPTQPLASGLLRARAASHSEPEEQAVTVELTGTGSREVLARATVILRQGHADALAAPGGP